MRKIHLPLVFMLCGALHAFAQTECKPFAPESTRVVQSGPVKSVMGPLADFDPCHKSVQLETPSFFAKKRGDKAPLVIISHGGGGLGGYERDFARVLNQNGYATLLFDAFEMNGLTSGSDLLLYHMSNGARQRMLYKVTYGAYQWAVGHPKVDSSRMFVQGLSNGGSVSINMAGAVDPAHVRGVVAEGGPAAGIGFPNEIKVPLLLIYGSADVYGGTHPTDFMHLRGNPCGFNEHYPLAPAGFAAVCNRNAGRDDSMPSPYAWYQTLKSAGADVRFELIEGAGHGMMFSDFSSSGRKLPDGRSFFQSRGASSIERQRVQKMVLDFIESKL